tara:strand:- start:1276 stop:1668 length:393 start_codon:yes stop_codon:yes gene_type:complete
MQKKIIKLTFLLIFISFCSNEKANADQKFWCIATSELLNNFPDFNDPVLSKEYGDDLVKNLKIYENTYLSSIKETKVNIGKDVNVEYGQLTSSIKKEDSGVLYFCKIWAEKNQNNFEQINNSRVGKDNSK